MDLDNIFTNSFLNDITEKENRQIQTSQEDRIITKDKQEKLKIIEYFLQKFVDLGVNVNHSDQYTKNTTTMDGIVPQKFSFYYVDSSKPFYPGVSIFLDHPATVEIAIPNDPKNEGVVVIKVASYHPFSYLLESRFSSYESACEALGKFLAKCTTSVDKDPRKYLRDIENKKQNVNLNDNLKNSNNDIDLSNSHNQIQEKPILKNSNPKGLKKISSLLKLNKNSEDEDE